MSLRAEIMAVAEDLFTSHRIVTFGEIRQELARRGTTVKTSSSAVRSTIYQMKQDDPRIRRVDRGVYQLAEDDVEAAKSTYRNASKHGTEIDTTIDYLNQTEKELVKIASQLETLKWFNCTEDELIVMKKRWSRLKLLHETVGVKLQRLA